MSTATKSIRRTFTKGRQTTGWRIGERIRSLDQLRIGNILFMDSAQFKATNLIRVESLCGASGPDEPYLFHYVYVMPNGQLAAGHEMAMWHWEIDDGDLPHGGVLHRAIKPEKPCSAN